MQNYFKSILFFYLPYHHWVDIFQFWETRVFIGKPCIKIKQWNSVVSRSLLDFDFPFEFSLICTLFSHQRKNFSNPTGTAHQQISTSKFIWMLYRCGLIQNLWLIGCAWKMRRVLKMLQILLNDLNMNQLFCSYFICYSCLKTRTFHSLNLLLPRIIWLEYRYMNNE